jgi:pimeloyl-ACP methyl ester carboxylesterase
MRELKQTIRFCKSSDGTRIAYATMGKGPPLVRTAHFFGHLEYDLRTPVWQPWLAELSRHHTLVRYDLRGCGLSDRTTDDFSLEEWVADFEAVVDAAGLDRFAVFGPSQGAAIAIVYATRHPERVTRLVLYGVVARGIMKRDPTPAQVRQWQAMIDLVELGWGQENPAFRQLWTSQLMPDASAEQAHWFNELERVCTTPECAARVFKLIGQLDATELLPRIRCPTVVLHVRGDARAPFEEGRHAAALIPGARFVPLEGRNHVSLEHEPAFTQFFRELHEFLAAGEAPRGRQAAFQDLTPRERETLELVAHGLDNEIIAGRLGLSEKTVRNHITAIFDKLGVPTRAQAIVRAREAGFAARPLDTPSEPGP